MLRILIVDDEPIIRRGIAKVVEETGLFDSVELAKNGLEALEMCAAKRYHVIFVDIKMPRMDGLEFLRVLAEREQKGREPGQIGGRALKVIISGYDEFSYAQRALELGVEEFLLKPLEAGDVRELARRMAEKARALAEDEEHQRTLQERVKGSLPLLRDRFFNELINEAESEETIERKSRFVGLDLTGEQFVAVAIGLPDADYSDMASAIAIDLFKERLSAVPKERFRTLVFDTGLGACAVICIFAGPTDQADLKVEACLCEVTEKIRKESGYLLHCGIGNAVKKKSEIRLSFHEAQSALTYTALYGENPVSKLSDEEVESGHTLLLEDVGELLAAVKVGDIDTAESFLERSLEQLRGGPQNFAVGDIKIMLTGVIYVCLITMRQRDVKIDTEKFREYYRILFDDKRVYSVSELRQVIFELVGYALSQIKFEGENKHAHLVSKAKELAKAGYTGEISTQSVAFDLGLSRNYFGQIFKKSEGIAFSEYISKLRIQKAKQLLRETTLKIYEVSDAVGIHDSFYFSALFKKYTGCSPSDYRG